MNGFTPGRSQEHWGSVRLDAAKERLEKGTLQMHAWFFEIDSAQLYAYNPSEELFLPIASDGAVMSSVPARILEAPHLARKTA